MMDISNARCTDCNQPLVIGAMVCPGCELRMEGEFEVSPLARLSLEDQIFVVAFVRSHGSIKKMESLFGISYPTVKNRLKALTAELDRSFEAPSPNEVILEQLAAGEISVDEALQRLGS